MRMSCLHLETGEPGEAVHSRPDEPLLEVEMDEGDEDVVVMARKKKDTSTEQKGGRGGKNEVNLVKLSHVSTKQSKF